LCYLNNKRLDPIISKKIFAQMSISKISKYTYKITTKYIKYTYKNSKNIFGTCFGPKWIVNGL